jgi:hypothetical protein
MTSRTRNTKPRKPSLHPDRLAQEAKQLRQRAKQSLDPETRIEFEEMAERREILAAAVQVFPQDDAAPRAAAAEATAPREKPPSSTARSAEKKS